MQTGLAKRGLNIHGARKFLIPNDAFLINDRLFQKLLVVL
jgi:hypothetical protein